MNRVVKWRYTEIVRSSQICPRCGNELAHIGARSASAWDASVQRLVVRCGGSVSGGACGYVVVRGVPRRKQVGRITSAVAAVVMLVASVVIWMGAAVACALTSIFSATEAMSVVNYGGGVNAWVNVSLIAVFGAVGMMLVGAWSAIVLGVRGEGAGMTLGEMVKRWMVLVAMVAAWMGIWLGMTWVSGDLVSGRNLAAARYVMWGVMVGLTLFWWVGVVVGWGVRSGGRAARQSLWKRRLRRARQSRPLGLRRGGSR